MRRIGMHRPRVEMLCATALLAACVLMAGAQDAHAGADAYEPARRDMLAAIRTMVHDTREYLGKTALDEPVMRALATVPRHEFVPAGLRSLAYLNRPLPIGDGQTISQPYMVALMTDLAALDDDAVVLEIGTGSGYQAAILAQLVRHVYTIEILESLGLQARSTLERLGYDNISVRIGDGRRGWPEQAPFDAILVTAAPEQVPSALLDQLKPGGRLVIPVGPQDRVQMLKVITRDDSGMLDVREVLPVGFVPLTGTP